jgi:hypothetical protein
MAPIHHWSVILASSSSRRPRWLGENGQFTTDPGQALRLVSPEVAARRVQAFMEIHGWPSEVMERFRLVPAPHRHDLLSGRATARSGQPHGPDSAAAA